MTDKKIAFLDENIEILSRMISACIRIKNGEARATVFADLKLDNRMFNIMDRYRSDDGASKDSRKKNSTFSLPTLNGAERLYLAVANVKSLSDIPSDVDETMEEVLNVLSENEHIVLKMRYWEGASLEACGRELSISPEGVRQIEIKAIKKLKHPAYSAYFQFGYRAYHNERIKALEKEMVIERERIACLEDELNALTEERYRLTDEVKESAISKLGIQKKLKGYPDDTPIEELLLTVRACNCLEANKITTFGDLRALTKSELAGFRHLGRKTLYEIEQEYQRVTGKELFSKED